MARRLAAIMFTDIAGYTAMSQADEAGALRLLQEHDRLVRPILEAHRGRKVKSTGDGLLLEFPDALDAVECGVELQRRIHEHNAEAGARRLEIRVGIHLGDVQRRGTDIFGDAVNIASRVEPLAEPGGICLSAQVFDQVHNKLAFQFQNLGPKTVKGVREPLGVYRVVLPWMEPGTTPSAGPVPPRLAILPLANISPDPKDEYFADGLTEELISVTSQARGLRVIARTSVMPYKSTPKSIAQIGAELGVDSVLEGSVRKAGDQLRITVQLIDVRTQEHRWAKTYDRKLENVFAIQAEVAEQTASALKVELLRTERQAMQEPPTSNLVAYEQYLRGIRAWQAASTSGMGEEEATAFFEEAIRQDPRFSAAYSYLANVLLARMGESLAAREVIPRARELIAKALQLSPDSSEAHTALGNLAFQGDQDWARAEAEFQQAIALNPSSSTARFWYGFLLQVLQRLGESRKQYLAAIPLDPLWIGPRRNIVWTTLETGDMESTVSLAKDLVDAFPNSPVAGGTLAWMYAFAGRHEEAGRLASSLPKKPELDPWSNRAAILAYLGRPEELRALVSDWERGRPTSYLSLENAATYYTLVGDTEKALAVFERDYREGGRGLALISHLPWYDPIRGEPRFVALLRAMKVPMVPRHLLRPEGPR